MAVFRIEKTRDYTVMSNHHLRNAGLSLKSKGLLSMMLSLPEDWNYTTRGLAKICKEGTDSIGSALKELERAGYIVRNRLRDSKGKIVDVEYVIYETPHPPDTGQPCEDEPDTACPDTENPDMDMDLLVDVFDVCSGIVATAAGSIGGLTGASVALPQEIADAIGDVGFLASIPLWLVTLLGSLFITVLAFIMILTVYGRFFKIYMYAALSPVALASFAGEGPSHFGKAFLRSYVGVCMEGAVIVLACIIFSAFSSSGTPVVDSSESVVTQVWSYLGEVIFNLLVLVGLVKSADHIVKEMLGL